MKTALVSFYPLLGDTAINLQKTLVLLERIEQENQAELVIFPELSLSGYLLENLVREAALPQNSELFQTLAAYSQKREIIVGSVLAENNSLYNAALVFSGGKISHIHRKLYLPTYGMFDEGRYFAAGQSLQTYRGVAGKTGILICEDAFHPALPYSLAAAGAATVVVISASPGRGFEQEGLRSYLDWKERLRTYALSFGQNYFYLNRAGVEDGVYFGGESFLVTAGGQLQEFSAWDDYVICELSPEEARSAFIQGGPWQQENWQLNLKLIQDAHENCPE